MHPAAATRHRQNGGLPFKIALPLTQRPTARVTKTVIVMTLAFLAFVIIVVPTSVVLTQKSSASGAPEFSYRRFESCW